MTVVGKFHGPDGSRVIAHLDENGIEPALTRGVLEEVVANPDHQVVPVLLAILRLAGLPPRPDVQISRA